MEHFKINEKWKKEIELIDNFGLLYPRIKGWPEYDKNWVNETKASWVCSLCIYNLDQRIPQLENFLKRHLDIGWWDYYKEYFKIDE